MGGTKCFKIYASKSFINCFVDYFFARIYWTADFFQRVELGIKIFDEQNIEWYDWSAFAVFVIAWSVYNHYAIWKSIKNSGKQCCFMITCCRINRDIESRFDTPLFDTSRFDEYGNLKNVRSPNSQSSLPEAIDKKLYIQDHESHNQLQQHHNDDDDDENIQDVGF